MLELSVREGGEWSVIRTVRPRNTTEVRSVSVSESEDGGRSYSIIIICYGITDIAS